VAETKLTVQLFLRSFIWFALMAVALFWAAGDWTWPQGWAFIAILVTGSIAFSAYMMKRDPALLASRLQVTQEGQAAWDRVFLVVFIGVWFLWLAFAGFDAVRFRWSQMPVTLNVVGGVLIAVGFLATMRVFLENSFAAPVVRVQEERHQRVITTGPYAIVRHPMYASAIPYLVGIPLLLGSTWALTVVPLFVIGVAIRSVFEERLLARELAGYAEYRQKVRWRIVPYVW
jgi:protein-S-isoprenylcysteine O-methyltransferase Ste14